MSCKPQLQSKLKSGLAIAIGGSIIFGGLNVYHGNEQFYSNILMPLVHRILDPEAAHKMAIKLAKYSLIPKYNGDQDDIQLLGTNKLGLTFSNPIGLAAGFDKNGEAINGLSRLGFGFLEVGSVTPKPQFGNDLPRVFRLYKDKAIINRYGFNNDGFDTFKSNLNKTNKSQVKIGLNIGKNKDTENVSSDYIHGLKYFYDTTLVDYFVINISSPNTPGLRSLQKKEGFEKLINEILEEKKTLKLMKPLLIKIDPDLNDEDKKNIARILLKHKDKNFKIDGIIISNTTISRPKTLQCEADLINEVGGLSGAPLRDLATRTIKEMYNLTNGQIPIIGVGGIFTGADAFEKVKAGASLVQIYTSLTYEGPTVVKKIKHEFAELLRENGFKNVDDAVGIEACQN